jgi:hypothetical protein
MQQSDARVKTLICSPWLSGFACYSRTIRLSFCPAEAEFSGTKCLSGTVAHFPKDVASVSENPGPTADAVGDVCFKF